MPDEPDALVEELKRLRSDVVFRRWVKRAIAAVTVALVLSVTALTVAVLSVRSQATTNKHSAAALAAAQVQACEDSNLIWSSLIEFAQEALARIPQPRPDATPEQIAAQADRVAEAQAAVDDRRAKFPPRDCTIPAPTGDTVVIVPDTTGPP